MNKALVVGAWVTVVVGMAVLKNRHERKVWKEDMDTLREDIARARKTMKSSIITEENRT